jgi:hypothetical protein
MTKTWNGSNADWYANSSGDWTPPGDPAATDDVAIGSGTVTLAVGDAGISVNSITLSGSGVLQIRDPGGMQAVAGNLALSGSAQLLIDDGGSGGSSLTIGGTLANSGTIDIGNSGISASTTVNAAGLSNTGTITITGSATKQATLAIAAAAPAILTGFYNLIGDALLEFGSGPITAIAANSQLAVDGSQAFVADTGNTTSNSALTGLASNAGNLVLRDGASISTSGDLANTGAITIDMFSADSGSGMSVAGTLTNSGSLSIGGPSLTAPDTVSVNSLHNTGSITLVGNAAAGKTATLTVAAPAGFVTTGVLTGNVGLTGDALVEFASGQITAIAANSQLAIDGAQAFVADAGSTSSNSALSGLASNAGNLVLRDGTNISTSGDLANTGTIVVDMFSADSGAGVSVGGKLTNSGTVSIGGTALTAADTVSANALQNAGSIEIVGNAAAGKVATLNIAAPAGFGTTGVLTGNVGLTGDALVEFASGQITAIAVNSTLTLDGTQAVVADAGSTSSNSALSGLSNVAGTLTLRDGANVSTSGDLANSGTINIDMFSADSGAGMSVGGKLTNTGALRIGGLALTAPDAVSANALQNTGSIEIAGNAAAGKAATLNIAAPAGLGTAGVLTGTVSLNGDALLEFASGQIRAIAANSTLTLDGTQAFVADAGSTSSNSALTGLSSDAGTFNLRDGGALAVGGDLGLTGALNVDANTSGEGGSSLSAAGTLTLTGNNAGLQIGNPGLSAPASVTTGGLANAGTVNLVGGSATKIASLNVTGQAVSSGTVNVGNFSQVSGNLHLTGGSLHGTGTVVGAVHDDGTATVYGGSSVNTPGILTIDGNYEQSQNGVLQVDLNGTGSSNVSTIDVTGGTVDLAGGTLKVNVLNPLTLALGQTFTVMNFTPGSQTGTFANLQDGSFIGAGNASLNIGNGLALAPIYNDAGGNIQLKVVSATAGPVIAAPGTAYEVSGYPGLLGPINITDPAAGTGLLTVVLEDPNATLDANPAGVGTVSGDNTHTLTLTGDLADINAELAGINYTGTANGDSPVSDIVQIQVTDPHDAFAQQNIPVQVFPVPLTVPVVNAPAEVTLISDTPTGLGGIGVSDPYAQATGQLLTLKFTANPTSFLTFTATGGPGGTTTGQGTNNLQINGTPDEINSYLSDGAVASLGATFGILSFLVATLALALNAENVQIGLANNNIAARNRADMLDLFASELVTEAS